MKMIVDLRYAITVSLIFLCYFFCFPPKHKNHKIYKLNRNYCLIDTFISNKYVHM